MRVDWRGEDNGGPFTSRQVLDLRDVIPQAGTFFCYLSLRAVGEPARGSASAVLHWQDKFGRQQQKIVGVDLSSEDQLPAYESGPFYKIAKDTNNPDSELWLEVLADDDATTSYTADLAIV